MDTTPSQNPLILKEIEPLISLVRRLFFNDKAHIACQRELRKGNKISCPYLPIRIDGELDTFLRAHLVGEKTIGFYAYSEEHTCRWLCFDVDVSHGLLAERIGHVHDLLSLMREKLNDMGIPREAMVMDFSGRKGIHLWVMLQETPLEKVQNFLKHLTNSLPKLPYDVDIDLYPYPTTDPSLAPFGHQVKLPCGYHHASGQYSHFIDEQFAGVIDVRKHLECVQPCTLPDLPAIDEWTRVRKSRRPAKAKKPRQKHDSPTDSDRVSLPAVAQPELTPELARVFTGCAFMREFRDRPDLATYREWSHAGLVLGHLGQIGAQWFAHLSSEDMKRYDGSHKEVIKAVSERGYSAPACRSMGCSRCSATTPLDHVRLERKRYRTRLDTSREADNTLPMISADELARRYLAELTTVLKCGQRGFFLSNLPLGVGKTTTTIQAIRETQQKCLFFAPTHRLGDEVLKAFGDRAVRIQGLDRVEETHSDFQCPHKQEIYASVNLGLSGSHFCDKEKGVCALRHACPYLQQFDDAEKADAVVLVHSHLHLGDQKRWQLMSTRDLIVIDESFVGTYRKEETYARADLERLMGVLRQVGRNDALTRQLELLLGMSHGCVTLNRFDLRGRDYAKIDARYRQDHPGERNVLRLLSRCANEEIPIKRVSHDSWRCYVNVQLPSDKQLLVLDATATAEDYQRLLERPVLMINPAENAKLERHARTIQVISGGYSNTSLLRGGELTDVGKRVIDFVKSHIRNPEDTGIICTLKMKSYLQKNDLFQEARILHFNALRGLNSLSGVLDLFVIGYQGLSYTDLVRNARIAFGQDWDDDLIASQLEEQKRFMPLRMAGQTVCEVHTLAPTDPAIESYYRMTVAGEVEQAIGRARMYRDCGQSDRRIWIITNIPTTTEIDEVIELPSETKDSCVSAWARRLIQEHGEFDRRMLAQVSGKSERHIRDLIDQIVVELSLVVDTHAHNRKVYRMRTEDMATG